VLTKIRTAQILALVVASVSACGSTSTSGPSTPSTPQLAAPAMIQVENSPEGRPQSGLGAANLVYEYVAEGGIGRFSLFFFGPPPATQQVGPVRSARTVTVQLASIYQAFLAYSGASTYITGLLNNASFPSYDENSAQGNLFRINSRYAPHNLYTNGADIAKLAALAKLPTVAYQLWTRTTVAPASKVTAPRFTVNISTSERPVFTWNATLGGYTRSEATGPVDDPTTGAPIVIPTVIVQQVQVTTDTNVVDVDGNYGVDHAITGTGQAQIFMGGKEYSAMWTQPTYGPPQFTLASGSAAPIAPGEVWICLVPTGKPAVVG
jgi:Protein of unknown function (DUF3048) N-terminal domain/Protein of unknown function (DUF3048) C-terminal domain